MDKSNVNGLTSIRKIEAALITNYQKRIHHIHPESSGDASNCYLSQPDDITFSVTHSEELTKTSDGYIANMKNDILSYVILICQFPSIRVKKKYRGKVRFKWTKNLMHHVIKKCEIILLEDKKGTTHKHSVQTFDDIGLDGYSSLFRDQIKNALYNRMIGNFGPHLKFNENIPPLTASLPILAIHSMSESSAIPLFFDSIKGLHHKIELNSELKKLLELEGLKSGKWKPISFNKKYIRGGIETIDLKDRVIGRYATMRDEEKNSWKKRNLEIKLLPISLIRQTNENYGKLGEVTVLDLKSIYPVNSCIILAQSRKCIKYNRCSNYTTNLDLKLGINPIVNIDIVHNNKKRGTEGSSYQTELITPFFLGKNIPEDPGYNLIVLGNNPKTRGCKSGITFNALSAKAKIKIGNKQKLSCIYHGSFADNDFESDSDSDIDSESDSDDSDSGSDSESESETSIKSNGTKKPKTKIYGNLLDIEIEDDYRIHIIHLSQKQIFISNDGIRIPAGQNIETMRR